MKKVPPVPFDYNKAGEKMMKFSLYFKQSRGNLINVFNLHSLQTARIVLSERLERLTMKFA
jgi:hypothetical protein